MQLRADLVSRQVRENGITYNIYGDSQGPDRSWRVGAVPNIVPAAEWQQIAAGVAQRARLLPRRHAGAGRGAGLDGKDSP